MSVQRLALRCTALSMAGNVTMYEDFSDAPGSNEIEDPDPSVARIAHEMDALQASLKVVEEGADPDEARLLGRTYLGRLEPSTIEEHVIEASLLRILGRSVEAPICLPRERPWEAHVAEVVALSWLAWAGNDNDRAHALVKSLRSCQKQKETFTGQGGAIHLLTLYFWSQAVELLVNADRPGARRFFKRAIEMGSQFGTDSHPMISWAYAASFFEP